MGIEEVLVETLEKKKRIIKQVKQRADLFDQYLASICLLDGVPPPRWLLSSDINELKKEELISGILLPRHQPAYSYSTSYYSQCQQPVFAADNGGLPIALKKGVFAGDQLPVLTDVSTSDARCVLNGFQGPDVSITSPLECRDLETSLYNCPDNVPSLVKIQRSKSRQRALELRNSAQASEKNSCSETCVGAGRIGIVGSQISYLECDHGDNLELFKTFGAKNACCVEGEATCKSGAKEDCSENGSRATGARISNQLVSSSSEDDEQPNCANELSESFHPSSAVLTANCAVEEANLIGCQGDGLGNLNSGGVTRSRSVIPPPSSATPGDCQSKEGGVGAYCSRITRSISSRQQLNHVGMIPKLGSSSISDKSCRVEAEVGNFQSMEKVTGSYFDRIKRSRSSGQKHNHVDMFPKLDSSSTTANNNEGEVAWSFPGSAQPCQQLDFGVVNLQEVLGTEANNLPCAESSDIIGPETCDMIVADKDSNSVLVKADSVSPGYKLDGTRLGVEISVSSSQLQLGLLVKPKQSDFGDGEECNLSETSNPSLESKQQVQSPEKEPSDLLHSAEILETVALVDCQGKPNSPTGMVLQREQDIAAEERKPWEDLFEAHDSRTVALLDKNSNSSIQQKRNSAVHHENANPSLMSSWPQQKQIRIWGQLPISPSKNLNALKDKFNINRKSEQYSISQVGDAMQSTVGKSPIGNKNQLVDQYTIEGFEFSSPKLQVEVGLALEKRDRSANIPFTLTNEQAETTSVSSLTKPVTGVSHCLVDKPEVADATSIVIGLKGQDIAGQNQVSLPPEDRNYMESVELFTHTENIVQERQYHLKQNGSSVVSPHSQSMDLNGCDQNMPEFEGFVVETDDAQPCVAGEDINTGKLEKTTIERASVMEWLCKSASLHTPISHFSTSYSLNKRLNLYQSIPNGLLEGLNLRTTLNMDGYTGKEPETNYSCLDKEVNCGSHEIPLTDFQQFSFTQSAWDIRKPCMSPVGNHWDGITSKSGSSGKRASTISELPCINEENENMDEEGEAFQDCISSKMMNSSVKRKPLADITIHSNPPASVCENELGDGSNLASVNTEFGFDGTCKKAKLKLRNQNSNKGRHANKAKENQSISHRVSDIRRANESLCNRSTKPKGSASLLEKEPKHNNIVSNITSFIPLVQQKKEAAAIAGKRDIKVKALEAAEAAKRLAEKKENERKMRKEALKLERARMEEQHLKQLELEKEKKEEQRKKKAADMATKKRQREEEERKAKERKRKCVGEAKKQKLEHEDEKVCEKKENKDNSRNHEKIEKTKDSEKVGVISKSCEALIDSGENSKDVSYFCKRADRDSQVCNTSQEQSYEISPYKGSDSEEEDDEDDIPNNKFIPSWASKNQVAVAISSQQRVDPASIFPLESFCNISEVLLPRRLQQI